MAEGVWGKLNNRFKQYGPATLAKRIAKKALSFAGFEREVYLYCGFDLREPFAEKKLPAGYVGRPLSLDDILHHSDISFSEQKLEVFKRRLASEGYSAVGIFKNDRLVGYAWLSLYTIEPFLPGMDTSFLTLAEHEGYLLDAFSHPDHRGNGFHPFYTWWRYDAIRKTGRIFAVTVIDVDNRSARTAQAKSGFRVLKKIIFRKNFGRQSFQTVASKIAL